jgi:hypothetical protein
LLSIEVYVNYDRAGYNLIKTITSADYWLGYHLAEVRDQWKWRTKQMKFKLKRGATFTETPRLYLPIINESITVWNKS